MAKSPKVEDQRPAKEAAERRDAILKRMLQTKPKQQKDVIAERKAKRGQRDKPSPS